MSVSESLKYYPVGLNLKKKNVLIVGAGRIAERKAKTLLRFGAKVELVAPLATRALKKLSEKKKIYWKKRKYSGAFLKKARLVIAATQDKKVNEKVASDAKKRGIWVNTVDCASNCDFVSQAIIFKKGLVVSVSSDAKNPRRAKEFKEFLKRKIDEFSLSRN